MKKTFITLMLALLCITSAGYAGEIPYTQEDRDRLIRVETKVEGVLTQIDDIKATMRWGFGLIFGGIFALIGFVLWDRRSALSPAIRKNKELEEREDKVERALKELALKDPKVAEALKHVGLL